MQHSRRALLLEWAAREHAMIIEDDYDSKFRYRGRPLPALLGSMGLTVPFIWGGFLKSSAWRCVLAILFYPYADSSGERSRVAGGARASLILQLALATFMQSGDFVIHLRLMRRIYARSQTHQFSALSGVKDLLQIALDPSVMHLYAHLQPTLGTGSRIWNSLCGSNTSI
tara:strand:- start:299 stop:808 length:510 start_codon:yes stop_codon:yes gene_type:complete